METEVELRIYDINKEDTTTKVAQSFYYDIGFTQEDMNDLHF